MADDHQRRQAGCLECQDQADQHTGQYRNVGGDESVAGERFDVYRCRGDEYAAHAVAGRIDLARRWQAFPVDGGGFVRVAGDFLRRCERGHAGHG